MKERRKYKHVPVDYWISMTHPLLGVVTGNVRDMSLGGLSVKLDENLGFFAMMELDARIHGAGWDDSIPSLTVQVMRVNDKEIGLRYVDKRPKDYISPLARNDSGFDFTDKYLRSLGVRNQDH